MIEAWELDLCGTKNTQSLNIVDLSDLSHMHLSVILDLVGIHNSRSILSIK
jgi:hypothetical protein